ncbi:MAG TPA: hypothetical protein VN750_26030 [Steroidobacteraceae bacterium]|nr:hypothetical protein [Steroidobacteraceae bacterium]
MLRIVIRTDNAAMAANVGGPIESTFKTFDVEIPAAEAFLRQPLAAYEQRQIVGVELLPVSEDVQR